MTQLDFPYLLISYFLGCILQLFINLKERKQYSFTIKFNFMKQTFLLCLLLTVLHSFSQKSDVAIMVDKMNVMYYGVENPITIGIPYDWKNTKVEITNGTITGVGSKRMVMPAAKFGERVVIRVISGSKSSEFQFRIKRIPDPIFKVGDGKLRMPSVSFKSQQYCRAELENFDFDLRYRIQSATITFHYFDSLHHETVKTAQIRSNKFLRKDELENQLINKTYNYYDSLGNRLDENESKIEIRKELKMIEDNPELDLGDKINNLRPGDFVEFSDIKVKSDNENEREIERRIINLY